jgi:hypothetical protein
MTSCAAAALSSVRLVVARVSAHRSQAAVAGTVAGRKIAYASRARRVVSLVVVSFRHRLALLCEK